MVTIAEDDLRQSIADALQFVAVWHPPDFIRNLAAAEVGDRETLKGLLAFADRHMKPTWKNGGLFYPRNDDLGGAGYTTALVGNAPIAGARLCPRDGFRGLYTAPWSDADLARPELCDVEFPAVLVREARYAEDGLGLRLRLAPGTESAEAQSFTATRLDPSRPIRIVADSEAAIVLDAATSRAEAGDVAAEFDRAAGRLRVSLRLDRERTIEIDAGA